MTHRALAARPVIHQVRVTGETHVACLLKRYRLLHGVTPGSAAPEMCLTSVIAFRGPVTETTFSVDDVVLAVARRAVPVHGEGQRLSVTGCALNVGVPAVSEWHVAGLGVSPHRRRETHRHLVRRAQLRLLMALRAR